MANIQIELSPKRVRAYLAGAAVLDTVQARLVWENPHYPAYYVPRSDVREDFLVASEHTSSSETRGRARHFDVRVGERVAAHAAWQYADSPVAELRALVR